MERKLTELCDIQYGYAFDSACFTEDDSYLPLVRIRDVLRGYSETYYAGEYPKEYVLHAGDLLIGMDGEFNIARWNSRDALLNQRVCKVTAKEGTSEEYLRFALSKALKEIESKTAFVTVKHLSAKELNKLVLDIPMYSEQVRIAETVSKIELIISARQQQLQKLDDLIKARFVEMFGDFDLSRSKPNWIEITELGKVVGGSTPKTSVAEYWDGEYRWISPAELKNDSGVIYDSVKKITKAGIDSCSLQELPVGTVILSSRAPIGKVAIAGRTFYCNQGFKNIICGERIIPRYLYSLLLFNTDYLNSLGRGATFKEISKSIVEQIKVPVPNIELQKEFEHFVKHLDKSKVAVQKALDEAQILFDSLMQKYFG